MKKKRDRVTPLRKELLDIAVGLEADGARVGKMALALALAQMEFWQRVGPKREKYLAEERQRLAAADTDEVRRQWGWFYKSGRELNADLHESSSASTMNRALKALTRAGILDAQTQPCRGKGRTLFYRLNLRVYRDCLRSVGAELSAEWLDLLKPDDAAPVRAGP